MIREHSGNQIIISAYNIASGGGLVLLQDTIATAPPSFKIHCFIKKGLCLESRHSNLEFHEIEHSILAKLKAERAIKRLADRTGAKVLCFANMPPIFEPRSKVEIFCQNRYILNPIGKSKLSGKLLLKVLLQKLVFRFLSKPHYTYIVQTNTMKSLLEHMLGFKPEIKVEPFYNRKQFNHDSLNLAGQAKDPKSFVYVASGEPHKNHRTLVEAWIVLKNRSNLSPELNLVLNRSSNPKLFDFIKSEARRHGLRINLLEELSREEVLRRIWKNTTIYPSHFESFGLPLIEAKELNSVILASDRDYVYDVCQPNQTFNPDSAESIAEAVERFLRNN